MSQSVVSRRFLAPRAQAFLLLLVSVVLWGFAPVGNRYFVGNGHLAMPSASYMASALFHRLHLLSAGADGGGAALVCAGLAARCGVRLERCGRL